MLKFDADVKPSRALVETVASLNPHNPFYTAAYLQARALLGESPCAFTLTNDSGMICGCTGFLRGNSFNRALELASVPSFAEPEIFWDGLKRFCIDQGVLKLYVESFASVTASIPDYTELLSRRKRYEYLLDLQTDNPVDDISTNHRRNITRARKAGLTAHRTLEFDACTAHVELLKASIQRRLGTNVEISLMGETRFARAILNSGAGEIFQVLRGGAILSSVLILKSACGAYYQSAGTSLEGASLGASPFLVEEMIKALKSDGLHVLNLGGAAPDSVGLRRFKHGFGGREILLESASFSMMPPLIKNLRSVATIIKELPCLLIGKVSQRWRC